MKLSGDGPKAKSAIWMNMMNIHKSLVPGHLARLGMPFPVQLR